jgi:starch phosphorylase
MQVEALVDTPGLSPQDLSVQLYAGPINASGQIERPQTRRMEYSKEMAPDRHLFTGTIDCCTSGRQGFAIRILPGHKDMATPFEPGLITWN